MNKYVKSLANKPICELTFDDIIELQLALTKFIKLKKELRKNATKSKAKMLDKYIKQYHIPQCCWKDVHYILDQNDKESEWYRRLTEKAPSCCVPSKENFK